MENKTYNENYYLKNKSQINNKSKEYNIENKDSISKNKKAYYELNKKDIIKKKKIYRELNKEHINKIRKQYRENNKEKIAEQNKLSQQKINSTVIGKLKHNIRAAIRRSLINKGYSKKYTSEAILGCNVDFFKGYLESKFESWMTWDNKGLYNGKFNYGWDIDHIIPLSSGISSNDIIKLNHYTNIQPLCSRINRDIKRDN